MSSKASCAFAWVNHRVFFKETADTVTIHRVRDRREAYR